ncbi:hypothetical protein CEXT_327561 [Caerostris extrusa]|uniref:Uncharacterized protein n=1 Tax=Caerostris extrusa TaxID=172846 RepID=A0AAV4S4Y9_CAEEX|nr:hypothetical protein CEXT_327561 [Caerostris extrusa]
MFLLKHKVTNGRRRRFKRNRPAANIQHKEHKNADEKSLISIFKARRYTYYDIYHTQAQTIMRIIKQRLLGTNRLVTLLLKSSLHQPRRLQVPPLLRTPDRSYPNTYAAHYLNWHTNQYPVPLIIHLCMILVVWHQI